MTKPTPTDSLRAMTTEPEPLTTRDARDRARVMLPDGREGELVYWPPQNPDWDAIDTGKHPRYSSRAKVKLPNGYVSVDPETLTRA